jgi:hypothetical protein
VRGAGCVLRPACVCIFTIYATSLKHRLEIIGRVRSSFRAAHSQRSSLRSPTSSEPRRKLQTRRQWRLQECCGLTHQAERCCHQQPSLHFGRCLLTAPSTSRRAWSLDVTSTVPTNTKSQSHKAVGMSVCLSACLSACLSVCLCIILPKI